MPHVYLASDTWHIVPVKFLDTWEEARTYLDEQIAIWDGDHPGGPLLSDGYKPIFNVEEMTLAQALNAIMAYSRGR